MKTRSFQKKLVVVALILLAIGIWIAWLWWMSSGLPHDIVRENITLEEAQRLVSFPICMPAYIPPEINPEPQIIYYVDDVEIPELTYIRLRYQRVGSREVAFEVYQRYTPDEAMRTEYPESQLESSRRAAIITLVYWLSPTLPSENERKDVMEQAKLEANSFQTNQTVWWLYEITDPIEYRSTMTRWIKDHVQYRILSYLPAEEIEKVTLSMLECSNP